MGTGAGAGGNRRAGRLLAAAAGATVVAAGAAAGAVAARRQRRRRQAPISPDESLAGPPPDRPLAPAPGAGPVAPPLARRVPAPAGDDEMAIDLTRSGDSLGAPVIDIRRRARGRAGGGGAVDDRAPGDRAADAFRLAEALTTTAPPATANGHRPSARPAEAPPAAAGIPPVGSDGPRDLADMPAAAPAGPARHLASTTWRRPSALALAVVVAVLVLVAGALVVGLSGDDGPSRAEVATEVPAGNGAETTTTALAPLTAAEAFASAGQRLTSAGSFSYHGTASASDVSAVRPTLWLAVDVTVDGQVTTTNSRLHEIALTPDLRATETVADGPRVWGRRAPSLDVLASQAYEPLPALSAGDGAARGAALLPGWLAAATAAVDAGFDAEGRRLYQATIPAAVLGEVERDRPAVDATVVLTLDDANDPVRVEITAVPGGPTLHLAYDISGIGTPIPIEPPT